MALKHRIKELERRGHVGARRMLCVQVRDGDPGDAERVAEARRRFGIGSGDLVFVRRMFGDEVTLPVPKARSIR